MRPHVIGDRRRRRAIDVPKDRVEHRPGKPGEFGQEFTELAVEIAEEQQRPFAQHGEARVVDRADGVSRLEQRRHQRGELIRQTLGVRCVPSRES